MAVEAPCIGTPPAIDTLVALPLFLPEGPGVDVREFGFDFDLDFGTPRSDTNIPAADGGTLGVCAGGGVAVFAGCALLGPALAFDDVDVPDFLPIK